MKYYLLLCVLMVGCRKKDNPVPVPTVQSVADDIGLKWEHMYSMQASNKIIFHENSTISEIFATDTLTYSVIYIPSSNGSTAILKDGKSLKVFVPKDTSVYGYFYLNSAGYNNDTTQVGVFLTGVIVQNNQPTLGASFPSWRNTYAILNY